VGIKVIKTLFSHSIYVGGAVNLQEILLGSQRWLDEVVPFFLEEFICLTHPDWAFRVPWFIIL